MAYTSFEDLRQATVEHDSLAAAAIAKEVDETGLDAAEIRAKMLEQLGVMRESIAQGLSGT
ncbi:MAG: hypothetical protein Q7U89_00875, partial [Coriobacteriia bacterium]|nr:hypothetical protein [Coriobacteriia bacterium]